MTSWEPQFRPDSSILRGLPSGWALNPELNLVMSTNRNMEPLMSNAGIPLKYLTNYPSRPIPYPRGPLTGPRPPFESNTAICS